MKPHAKDCWSRLTGALLLGAALAFIPTAGAQVRTNWVTYNDYGPGPAPDPGVNDGWGTASGVTGFDMGFGPGGQLINHPGGQYPVSELPAGYPLAGQASLVVTPVNANGVFALPATPGYPFPDTPAYDLFHGIVDMGNLGSAFGVGANQSVRLTFTQLNPAMKYKFRGSVVRNGTAIGTHDVRWTLNSIEGAQSFVSAHSSGVGMVTVGSPVAGLTLTNGQAAFQSGINTNGMTVGWDDIVPAADGTFTVVNQPYNGPTDVASSSANVGYVLTAIVLTEYGPLTPLAFTTQPVASISTTQLLTFSLTVKASGSAQYYQWYKQGAGAIAGANEPTYKVPVAALADAGSYFAVVTNSLGSITSSTATVTIAADNVAPSIARLIGNATFDGFTVEFNEPVDITEAGEVSNYTLTGPTGQLGLTTATPVTETGVLIDGVLHVTSVTVTTGTALDQDTTYTVKAVAVMDGANNVTAGTPASLRTWLSTPASGLYFEAYFGIGGLTISDLTGSPSFPNSPSQSAILGTFDSREIYADDTHENYGTRIRGLFIPPYSGSWRFYIRSDDAGRLFLNPNGPEAAGKIQIIDETGCCGDWNKFQSEAFPLVGGRGYYIESLNKEAGGGDYIKVAARLDGTGIPALGASVATIDPSSLAGSSIGFPAAPQGVGGSVTIVQQPTNLSVNEGQQISFSVTATNTYNLPMSFQWLKNGLPVPDATSATYSLVSDLGDDNSQFSVDISIIGFRAESDAATLRVQQDTTAPTLVSATVSSGFNQVIVTFNELLDNTSGTATDRLNYEIIGPGNVQFEVVSATLRPDGKSVLLVVGATPALEPGTTYTVRVNNVADRAGNAIVDDSTAGLQSFPLSRGFLQYDYYSGIAGNDVALLEADPRFIAQTPTETHFLAGFDSHILFPGNEHETFGAKISGVFIPPISGNWIFYLASDDASRLSLNPDGVQANGAIMLTEETGCCHGFVDHPSAPQELTAGQAYYIEALYKEGTGGDFCQVAAKLETDPTPPNSLTPIPGAYLGIYLDPAGSSVAFTKVPESQGAASPVIKVATGLTFTAGDGGFSVENLGPIGNTSGGPWTFDAAGGLWSVNGTEGCATPSSSALISHEFEVQADGAVTLKLTHRYNFEADTTLWDGGQLRLSLNGAPFETVSDIPQNGYTGVVGGNNILGGQDSFTGASADYSTGATIDTIANLGTFVRGDKIRFELLGAWDECTRAGAPNWDVRGYSFPSGSLNEIIPSPAVFTAAATGNYKGDTNPPFSWQWQKDTGAGFQDIPGANSSRLILYPSQSDNNAKIRVIVYIPGASAVSPAATLTVGPDLDIQETGPGNFTLSWPASSTGFRLEQTSALLPSGTVWSAVPNPVTVVNDRNTVSITGATGDKAYRLISP